ncbi:class I SAM-dependent methyltransferase, partial [Eubacterium callanderi]
VGAGSGAFALGFLEKFQVSQATLVDIRQVLPQTRKRVEKSPNDTKNRVMFHEQNILDPDWLLEGRYDLV